MAILADKNTRLIVQGITGREGDFHARQMQAYSPIVVGGVTPGKGGMVTDYGVPVCGARDVYSLAPFAMPPAGSPAPCLTLSP